jgi:hypothetical protein
MLDVTLSILAVIAGGVIMEMFTIACASLRAQDKAGWSTLFDMGALPENAQTGNPS